MAERDNGPKPDSELIHRRATRSERSVLSAMRKHSEGCILVPVRFHGEDRYAVGVIEDCDGSDVVHLLAICLNPVQDASCLQGINGDTPEYSRAANHLN